MKKEQQQKLKNQDVRFAFSAILRFMLSQIHS